MADNRVVFDLVGARSGWRKKPIFLDSKRKFFLSWTIFHRRKLLCVSLVHFFKILSWLRLIVGAIEIIRRTVVYEWRSDNLSGSHFRIRWLSFPPKVTFRVRWLPLPPKVTFRVMWLPFPLIEEQKEKVLVRTNNHGQFERVTEILESHGFPIL